MSCWFVSIAFCVPQYTLALECLVDVWLVFEALNVEMSFLMLVEGRTLGISFVFFLESLRERVEAERARLTFYRTLPLHS